MIELRHLRYFVAVSRHKNFTRAAQALRISQPGLSMQIQQLETRLAAPLLVRGKRGVELTDAGEALRKQAGKILRSIESLEAGIKQLAMAPRLNLSVGAAPSLSNLYFAPLVAKLKSRYPGLSLQFLEERNEDLIELVRRGKCDIALIDTAFVRRDALRGLSTSTVKRTPLVGLVAMNHRLARRRRVVRLDELRDEHFVFMQQASTARLEHFVQACMKHGFTPKVQIRTGQVASVFALVAQGYGITTAPELVSRVINVPLAKFAIAAPDFVLALAWRKDRMSPVLGTLLSLASESEAAERKSRDADRSGMKK